MSESKPQHDVPKLIRPIQCLRAAIISIDGRRNQVSRSQFFAAAHFDPDKPLVTSATIFIVSIREVGST